MLKKNKIKESAWKVLKFRQNRQEPIEKTIARISGSRLLLTRDEGVWDASCFYTISCILLLQPRLSSTIHYMFVTWIISVVLNSQKANKENGRHRSKRSLKMTRLSLVLFILALHPEPWNKINEQQQKCSWPAACRRNSNYQAVFSLALMPNRG